MLSVQAIQCRIAGLMNGEFEMVRKEATVAKFKVLPRFILLNLSL
jgi:hypothetical protein